MAESALKEGKSFDVAWSDDISGYKRIRRVAELEDPEKSPEIFQWMAVLGGAVRNLVRDGGNNNLLKILTGSDKHPGYLAYGGFSKMEFRDRSEFAKDGQLYATTQDGFLASSVNSYQPDPLYISQDLTDLVDEHLKSILGFNKKIVLPTAPIVHPVKSVAEAGSELSNLDRVKEVWESVLQAILPYFNRRLQFNTKNLYPALFLAGSHFSKLEKPFKKMEFFDWQKEYGANSTSSNPLFRLCVNIPTDCQEIFAEQLQASFQEVFSSLLSIHSKQQLDFQLIDSYQEKTYSGLIPGHCFDKMADCLSASPKIIKIELIKGSLVAHQDNWLFIAFYDKRV